MSYSDLFARIGALERRLARLETVDSAPGVSVGTAFMTNPLDGTLFYRTDLDAIFRYDDGRSKWLGSLIPLTFGRNGALSTAVYLLSSGGVVGSATVGYLMPFDATLVGWNIRISSAATATFRMRANGANIGTLNLTSEAYKNTLVSDTDVSQYDVIAAILASGTVTSPVITAFFRRRAT